MEQKIEQLESLLQTLLSLQSEAISVDGLMALTGWTKGYIYKLTSKGILAVYKPNGKTSFYKKSEIESYLLSNRKATITEIKTEAADYVLNNRNK